MLPSVTKDKNDNKTDLKSDQINEYLFFTRKYVTHILLRVYIKIGVKSMKNLTVKIY